MRVKLRILLFASALLCALALSASAAYASFGIETFVAVNCNVETCAEQKVGPFSFPKEPNPTEEKKEGFTQAGGRVPFGITHFKVNTTGPVGEQIPDGAPVTHIRTDVAPGLATNPQAVPQCSKEEFGTVELVKGSGAFPEPTCSEATEIGVNKVVVYVALAGKDAPLEGTVYNLVPDEGHASEFGVAVSLAPLGKPGVFAHTLIKGNVEWGKGSALDPKFIGSGTNAGDYHDYFEIEVSPALPLVASRLVFFGNENQETGKPDDFITNATSCPGNSTTTLRLEDEGGLAPNPGPTRRKRSHLENCGAVPFEQGFKLTPATLVQDQPDGFTTEVTVHHEREAEIDNSEVKSVTVTLPEGMTLNPSAAAGLTACTPAQARIHSSEAGVACPSSSEVGTVNLEVPTLPAGSLKGTLYLGWPRIGSDHRPRRTRCTWTRSPRRYGVSVRLKGEVFPNETTGQLTTVFNELPEQPFSNAILHFKEGALAPVANPLACSTASSPRPSSTPYSGNGVAPGSWLLSFSGCTNPLALVPSQATSVSDANAGDNTSFTFNLERPEGNQYLSQLSDHAAGGTRRCRARRRTVPRTAGLAGRLSGRQPDRHRRGARRIRPHALHVLRSCVLHRSLQRRSLRALDRRAVGRRAVQPRDRDHACLDQRPAVHRAGGRRRPRCHGSSRAFRSGFARSS